MCSLKGNIEFKFLMTTTMCARAVFICRPNSHPFQERKLALDQAIKIGRSVARARPTGNNAIFDCKVLSRNHALLWFDMDTNKFYLQDTKSSNGTFVNNQRLSKSSEESKPRELCSGDIVQFGVDVMEVNKKSPCDPQFPFAIPVTHGCIIATVQLFLPDGKEAKASSSTIVPDPEKPTPVQDIYLLNQYLKEAMLREQVLENKLAIMTKHLAGTKEFMEQNWKALIEEDRLLTRVDILERQLQASHKSMTDDKLREEVVQLLQDKEKYQNIAKDAIRRAMQDKLETLKKLKDAERDLQVLGSQKASYEEMCERSFKDLKELAEKYEEAEQRKKEITDEMNLSTQKYKDEISEKLQSLKERDERLRKKQLLIQDLCSRMEEDIARGIIDSHQMDPTLLLPARDTIITVDSSSSNESLTDNRVKSQLKNDVESLKSQLKNSESEKKEVLAKLSQLLNLFEDLKAVSNKVQVSEYVSELIGKMDLEIKQIKNFIQGDDTLKNNSYSISEDVSAAVRKSENHLEEMNTLEKLLEDSRETIKSLENEHIMAEQQNSDLRRQMDDYTFQLRNYMVKVEDLTGKNDQLSSDRDELEKETGSLKQLTREIKEKLSAQEQLLSRKEEEINILRGELNPNRRRQINNLGQDDANRALIESSDSQAEALKSTISHNNSNSIILSGNAYCELLSDGRCRSCDATHTKMIELEEELAVYKDKFSESSSQKNILEKCNAELRDENLTLRSQSKSVNLLVVVPLIILLLAILIALRPSS